MLNYSNPYDVLSETISFENVQLMGEMITLKTLRRRYAYARYTLEWLYVGLVKDLNRSNNPAHTFSDAYDLVQTAICFLCDFIGKTLNDVYMVKNGQEITIKRATYLLVNRHIEKMRRHLNRTRDIDDFAEELSVDIDRYQEKDYNTLATSPNTVGSWNARSQMLLAWRYNGSNGFKNPNHQPRSYTFTISNFELRNSLLYKY